MLFKVNMHGLFFWKKKKCIRITNAFQTFLDEFYCKKNKICIDKGSKCYNRSTKSRVQDNYLEMHSTHNEKKSVIAERCIRILKNKI